MNRLLGFKGGAPSHNECGEEVALRCCKDMGALGGGIGHTGRVGPEKLPGHLWTFFVRESTQLLGLI